LADPYAHENIGKAPNMYNDLNGVTYAKIINSLTKRGGGFAYFIHPNPDNSNALELKLQYKVKADEELYLTSGINESRKELISFVESAREFALNHTKEEALKAFNDPNGVDQIRNMRDLAANWGDGFFYYIWPNPAHSNARELKLAYVMKVNDEWFLASGIYLPEA